MRLKKLLEGFAWERESGKPLPTIQDVAKKYNESVDEASAEYTDKRLYNYKVGDMVGNSVEGFDHKVLRISGNKVVVQQMKSGRKITAEKDNYYLPSSALKEAMPTGISDRPVDIKSDILKTWKNSDIVQEDLESYLQMIYLDGNYDTMDDMAAMFNVLSKLAKEYRKKMYYNKFD